MHFEKLLEYEDVRVVEIETNGVRIIHSKGAVKIDLDAVPEETRKILGYKSKDSSTTLEKPAPRPQREGGGFDSDGFRPHYLVCHIDEEMFTTNVGDTKSIHLQRGDRLLITKTSHFHYGRRKDGVIVKLPLEFSSNYKFVLKDALAWHHGGTLTVTETTRREVVSIGGRSGQYQMYSANLSQLPKGIYAVAIGYEGNTAKEANLVGAITSKNFELMVLEQGKYRVHFFLNGKEIRTNRIRSR